VERQRLQRGEPVPIETKVEASDKWVDESRKFEETRLLLGIVCGPEVTYACHSLRLLTAEIAAGIYSNDREIYSKSLKELVAKSSAVTTAIRKELETDKTTYAALDSHSKS